VALTAPADGAIVGAGSPVTLTAAASDADGLVTNVVFFVDGAAIGSDPSAPYTLGWTATAGAHRLTVAAVDNSGTGSTSAPVNLFVSALLNTNLVLVGSNSVWRYLETNATPDPAWITAAYDDRGWKSGPGQLGFGDNDEATRVTNFVVVAGVTNRVYTHYFRREFTVDSLVGITNVLLRVLRDDGAVAYLNGVEVFRSNMATGRVTHTNLAVASVSGLEENTFFPTNLPLSSVRLGANLLAVEVHQQTTNNVDLSFAAEVILQRSVLGPAILTPPSGRTNPPGSTATFAVIALGGEPLVYQWLFNGLPLDGATAASLVLPGVQPSHAGDYSVVVTNLAGAVTSAVARLVVTPSDRDGDGLPDEWELANGTNPDLADADTDLDGDGLSNRQEFVAGTRPNDATSVLRIGTIDVAGGGTAAVVTFNAVAAHSYSLLSRPGAVGAVWLKVADIPPVPVSGPVSVTNATAGAAERFYRIVTPAQP